MLKHADIWRAIDDLAREHGFSASGLAKSAGLDPTAFNRSKRITADGKLRWPSTESIAKVLRATGASLGDFLAYTHSKDSYGQFGNIPLIGLAQAGSSGYFDDAGYPVGASWDEIPFPQTGDENAYALEITGTSMEPVYRDGDRIIVSPQASIRRGDRIVLKTRDGEIMAKALLRQTAHNALVGSFNPDHEDRIIPLKDIDWMARIVWASQ